MLTDLPNLLTLSRIAAIPLLVALVALHTPGGDLAACVVFAAAAITDYFDGQLARDRRQHSDLGRMLDPIADKLLVGASADDAGRHGPAVALRAVSRDRHHAARDPGQRPARIPGRHPDRPAGDPAGEMEDRLPDGRPRHAAGRRHRPRLLHLAFLCRSPLIGEAMLWVAAVLTLVTGWDYLTAGLHHAAGPRPAPARCPNKPG